ncbi:MAG: class I SAM-dependent methyltransferase [Gemmatimonadota bacterium]
MLCLEDLPVLCNALYDTAAEAVATDRADIVLDVCRQCGMLWNAAFESRRVAYAPGYENSLYGSPTFQRFAASVCTRLANSYELSGSHIVEIGSGDGRFLVDLCTCTGSTGLGIDPGYVGPCRPVPSVRIVRQENGIARNEARLVVIRHVLEHIGSPRDFLIGVSARCEPAGLLYCEVPNARGMLQNQAFWDLIYEHPLYFSSGPLIELLGRCGFSAKRIASEYDDQFLCLDAVKQFSPVRGMDLDADLNVVHEFARAFQVTRDLWGERLEAWADQGRRIALWGIGSKGTAFLSAVGGPFIDVLVDVNERKHGRYVPVVGRPVNNPAVLSEDSPDLVLVSNPLYLDEIRAELEDLGVVAELVTLWGMEVGSVRT